MNIVSSSFGKDSTAMIHLLLENNIHIDKVMYFESGWDFPQMEDHIKLVVENTGIDLIKIRYYRYFDEMLKHYGWPHKSGGWCVRCKINTCLKYFRGAHGTCEFIGFTTDELKRTKSAEMKKRKWSIKFPLIDYGFSEKDALNYCKSLGYHWNGLYDVFNRVSCFCCPKAGKKRIEELKQYYPELYLRWKQMYNKSLNLA